jgi:site-specific DNA-methyltransferase (adenine-specific)
MVESPDLAASVHWVPAATFPVHRWFRYREGFSPYLFDYFPGTKSRLDPFCGCGTTLLESAKQGVRSCGIDVNPLATFVTRVKTRRYGGNDKRLFLSLSSQALQGYRQMDPARRPECEIINKLFPETNLEVLLRLKAFIANAPTKKQKDLLMLAWLSILEDCSNVFKEGNGLKYRNKRRRPGKYMTLADEEWMPRYFGNNLRLFVETQWQDKCAQVAEDIEGFRLCPGFTPRVRTGSCMKGDQLDFGTTFDLVIFSPPYANRFDYFEAFKMELWMGGFVKRRDDMLVLRRASMRNNLAAPRHRVEEFWGELRPFLSEMDDEASSVHMGIKGTLEAYFLDMRVLLCNLRAFIEKKGTVGVVIGNSAYAKSIIPTDVLIAKLGIEEGYKVKTIRIARRLHVSSQQRATLSQFSDFMRESLVIMEK